jgi:hypothetical protein
MSLGLQLQENARDAGIIDSVQSYGQRTFRRFEKTPQSWTLMSPPE